VDEVTVLIPNYKHEYCIDEAWDSVYDQVRFVEIINDYPQMGKGFRLNTVMHRVETEWVNIHDADDVSAPNRFEICSKHFEDYDVIYHDTYVRPRLWIDGKPSAGWIVHRSREWDRESYKAVNYIAASSVIIRSEIAKKVKWVHNSYGQDWIWLNQVAELTDRFKYIPMPLLYYRGEYGFTNKLSWKSLRRVDLRRKIRSLTK
jgi:hypothetical protein